MMLFCNLFMERPSYVNMNKPVPYFLTSAFVGSPFSLNQQNCHPSQCAFN